MDTVHSVGLTTEVHAHAAEETCLYEEHTHPYHELYYLMKGSARYFINSEILNVQAGDVAFVQQGAIHKATYDYGTATERLLVSFTTDFIGEPYLYMLRSLGEVKRLCLSADDAAELQGLFLKLHREFTDRKEHYRQQCKNLLRQIVILLSRQETDRSPRPISSNEAIIQQAATYISENCSEPLCLQTLARMHAMSESHFSRTFKRYTGMGVAQYVKLVRLQKAEGLLLQGEDSVTEIAYACGFNNSNYFISEFKKHMGMTPLQYAIAARNKR